MWGDTITEDSGIPIGPLDEVILYQGCEVTNGSETAGNPKVKISYPKAGTYWVWFPPAYSANYDIQLPSCTLLEYQGSGNKCWKDNVATDSGAAEKCFISQRTNESQPPDCPLSNFDCNYYCGKKLQPAFHNIPENEPYNLGVGPYGWYEGFGAPQKNAATTVFGYPCSTEGEDNCCRDLGTIPPYTPINSDLINGVPPGNCNQYGLTAYRRRLLEAYYPWAWEIFSFNEDKLINFGRQITNFKVNQTDSSAFRSAYEPTPGTYLTSLRHQFLGYAHCQHHFDRELGCIEFNGTPSGFPLGKYIPRQFIYSCSGIPMFEFDFDEAERDGIDFDISAQSLVEKMRSFTVHYQSPLQTSEPNELFPVQGWPTENDILDVRRSMDKMSSQKYSGFATKDWRKEALLELFQAEQIYRDYSGNPNFDLFDVMSITRPDISTPEAISEAIQNIFPTPLGPVRKRCRSVQIEDDIRINTLTPKNILTDAILVAQDSQSFQSLSQADITIPMRNLGAYGLPTQTTDVDAYTKLYAKISSLCYTYFRMMPGGWDWCTFGPMPNGNDPQNNWWFRKMGVIQQFGDRVPYFQFIPPHSQIQPCTTTTGNAFDFAWNPTGRGILSGDIEDPDPEPFETGGFGIGSICDYVCGRSTYSSDPNILVGYHSAPYRKSSCAGGCCINSCRPPTTHYTSYVRYSKKQFGWDTSSFPYKSKSLSGGELSFLNEDITASIAQTNAPCCYCFPQNDPINTPDCFDPPGSFSPACGTPPNGNPLNAGCFWTSEFAELSPCKAVGIQNEIRLRTDGVVSASGNSLKYSKVEINDCGSQAEVFGCAGANGAIYDTLYRKQVENAPEGYPACRFYGQTCQDDVTQCSPNDFMFTDQCCNLISNCNDCNTFMENQCWFTASRWCNSPKYNNNSLAYVSDTQLFSCIQNFIEAPNGDGQDDLFYVNNYFYENLDSGSSPFDPSAKEYLCNSDATANGLSNNTYTPTDQNDCSGLMVNISESYLQSVNMPSNMINRYKGSFCFCQAGSTGSASGTPTTDDYLYSLTNPDTPDNVVCSLLALRLCGGVDLVKYNCAYRKLTDGTFPCDIEMNDSSGNPCSNLNMLYYLGECYKLSTVEQTKTTCENAGGIWSAIDGSGFPCWTQDSLGKIIDGCYKIS
jgi:hypothetical protein